MPSSPDHQQGPPDMGPRSYLGRFGLHGRLVQLSYSQAKGEGRHFAVPFLSSSRRNRAALL
jgi:hypothetical protein